MKILIAALFLGVAVCIVPQLVQAPLFLQDVFVREEPSVKVMFVGDLMFDRYIRQKAEQFGENHTLMGVKELLHSADLVAGNLEGPVTSTTSVSIGTGVGETQNMRFTFPNSVPQLLKRYGFSLVSIGNNHLLDFGRSGVEETKQHLTDAGISFIGDPLRESPDIVVEDVAGFRIAFVAYNEFFGQTIEDVTEAVRAARERADIVVVMAHWGEEYLPLPPDRIRTTGHAFIDAGASLVIGTHPHVVQPFEDYAAGRIYYSLGNFVFDQYWDSSVRCGLVVVAHVSANGITYTHQDVGMQEDGSTVEGCTR